MKGLLKIRGFWAVVLVLTVLSLVFSGCKSGSGSGGKGGPGPGGNGGSGKPGEIDLTAYIGTWVSPANVEPAVEFTISEFLESEDGVGGKVYHFAGSVKCTALSGGEIVIADKQDPIAGRRDTIHVQQYDDDTFLFVKAGFDTMEGGTVELTYGQWVGNNLTFHVSISGEDDTAIYETAGGGFTDVFTKK